MRTTLALYLTWLSLSGLSLACGSDQPTSRDRGDSRGDDVGEDDDEDSDDDAPDARVAQRDAGTGGGRVDAAADASRSNRVDGGATLLDATPGATTDGRAPAPDATSSATDARVQAPDANTQTHDAALPSERPKPKCVKKDSQVIVIGDSYINWVSHTFPQDIVRESGQMWRMEAVGGYAMATGGTGLIPASFDESIRRDPDAHTVLMDGGGNDVLIGDSMRLCRDDKAPTVPFCQKLLDDALAAADKLLDRAAAAGIRDVVYFFYPHVPKNTLLGGPDPNHMLDYSLPKVRDLCEQAEERTDGKLRCYFVDMVPVFAGKPESEWFFPGDIHPTSVGSQAMAKAVWSNMKEHCVAQKAESGCCEP